MNNDGMETTGGVRGLLAGLTLMLPAALVALSWSRWRASIPERVAFHWDARGRSDGTFPTEPLFLFAISASVLVFVIGVVILLVPRIDQRTRRSSMYWLGFVAAFTAVMWLVPAGLTHHTGSPGSADLDGWLAAFILPMFYGGLPWLLTPPASPVDTHTPRLVTLEATEVGAWSKTIHTRLLYGFAAVIAGAAAAIYVPLIAADEVDAISAVGLVVMVLAVLAVLSFAALRVTVDWRGIRVRSLLTRIPFKRIPVDLVDNVEIADLHPGDWGGWGYRVTSGRSAIILRSGPGMIVTTIDGTQFALTIATPKVPAGLLRTLADTGTGRPRPNHH